MILQINLLAVKVAHIWVVLQDLRVITNHFLLISPILVAISIFVFRILISPSPWFIIIGIWILLLIHYDLAIALLNTMHLLLIVAFVGALDILLVRIDTTLGLALVHDSTLA